MRKLSFIPVFALLTLTFTVQSCGDQCDKTQCLNGATCSNGNCTCALGWEGQHCDFVTTDKFVAKWESDFECGFVGSTQYDVEITHGTDRTKFLMKNFDNAFIDDVVGEIIVDTEPNDAKTHFIINSQEPDGDGFFVEGDGFYISDTVGTDINISYKVTDSQGGNSFSCDGWWDLK